MSPSALSSTLQSSPDQEAVQLLWPSWLLMLMLCILALLPQTLIPPPLGAAGTDGTEGTAGTEGTEGTPGTDDAWATSAASPAIATGWPGRGSAYATTGVEARGSVVAGVIGFSSFCCAGRSAAIGRAEPSTTAAAARTVLRETDPRRSAGLSTARTRPSNCERRAMASAPASAGWRRLETMLSSS